MNSRELRSICRSDPELKHLFLGVFPCDKLPEKETGFIICNEDKHTAPGSHWVCIFLLPNKRAEFFNSYGGSPSPHPIVNYLDGWDVVCSEKQVQSYLSTTCGQHCIFYAYHRCRGVPLASILDIYERDLNSNDQMVCEFVEVNFGFETAPCDDDLLHQQIARAFQEVLQKGI